MRSVRILKALLFVVVLLVSPGAVLRAADESYVQTLSGVIKTGDSCTVTDDKFLHLSVEEWNRVRNLSVENVVTFELRHDTSVFFYKKPFTCTLNVSIRYFTSKDQQVPEAINNVDLAVRYDTATGSFVPMEATYRFQNAFKVIVIVNSISSPELGSQIPPVFRVKNQIFVKRKYPFQPDIQASFQLSEQVAYRYSFSPFLLSMAGPGLQLQDGKLMIQWSQADFGNSEEYDIEWTYVDRLSERGQEILTLYGDTTGPFTMPEAKVAEWMKNDNTRVTVSGSSYTLNATYSEGYILVRMRGASYETGTHLRLTTNWQYKNGADIACVYVRGHESALNWQYSASFAEEGKRKEVVSYMDGSLRNRQTVTLNNADEKAVVAETIYDSMGRPAASILPAPVASNRLQFYGGLNRNEGEEPYSYADITGVGCSITAKPLSTTSSNVLRSAGMGGASQYYSSMNTFLDQSKQENQNYYFSKYIPDAEKYPLAVTEYTPDNTGRIRRQGGVGKTFQLGDSNAHYTQYFYGKPLPRELDRLFGVEVGYASHYLKNMVMDANGQISVSYVDANGKTIATALAGGSPPNLEPLSKSATATAMTPLDEVLIRPADFEVDAGALQLQASATFLAAVTGEEFKVHFSVNPAALVTLHGSNQRFCSNCFYEMVVVVTDDCGNTVGNKTTTPFLVNDNTCHDGATVINDYVSVSINKIGEYTVRYSLRLSEQVLKDQTDYYVDHNTNLKTIQTFFNDELLQANLKGCYSECSTCIEKLGTLQQFTSRMMAELQQIKDQKYTSFPSFSLNSVGVQNWIVSTYNELNTACQASQAACQPESPCEQRLSMMKRDVQPGGQYAPYNYDTVTKVYAYTERDINVMRLYNQSSFPDIQFRDEAGQLRSIKSLSESEFIRYYIQHAEWADQFVLQHIEYCSYLWCKDQSYGNAAFNNEASYRFDEQVRRMKGTDAVQGGYYNQSNYKALVDKDPFFNGGRGSNTSTTTYKTRMENDLLHLSSVLQMRPKDLNNNALPEKTILQLIDWILYCKPVSETATAGDFVNSWTCSVGANCRSVSREWELYRNYYLKLKAKYMELAKRDALPGCTNCFVGKDLLYSTNPTLDLSNAPVPCPPASEFVLERDTVNYQFDWDWNWERLNYEADVYYKHPGGPVMRPVTFTVYTSSLDCYNCQGTITQQSVTLQPGEERIFLGREFNDYEWYMGDYDYESYSLISIDESTIHCPTNTGGISPSSTCTNDPAYNLYKNKNRIFNDYVNEEGYLNDLNQHSSTTDLGPTRQAAIRDLDSTLGQWFDHLKAVRDEAFLADSITDATLNTLVQQLYAFAKQYIDNTSDALNIRAVSTNGSSQSFRTIFESVLGLPLVQRGFGPDLLDMPYPHDKAPVLSNPIVGEITPAISNTLNGLLTRAGNNLTTAQFHIYLQQELGADYTLTLEQLTDLVTRKNNGCRVLNEPLSLPAVFARPEAASTVLPGKSCSDITLLRNTFAMDYPSVPADTKLYRVLFTNFMNHHLGYTLTDQDYEQFAIRCITNSGVVLYNQSAAPVLPVTEYACELNVLKGVFEHAGQAYELYIEAERKAFRNKLVSLCLSNAATARIEGKQYEYHYTLYYYDQSGNLVKTVPPEGVQLLPDDKLALVDQYRSTEPNVCSGAGIPTTEDQAATFNALSGVLTNNTAHALETWLYSADNSSSRQLRFVTPDQKYFYQAAIANQKLWVELYSIQPVAGGGIELVRSNSAVADLSGFSLNKWSHLFVQAPGALTGQQVPVSNTALTAGSEYVSSNLMTGVSNNFTYEMWVNPTTSHQIDLERQTSADGTSGQVYAVFPAHGGSTSLNRAGMGISVGTNGVSVYEHADSYMPALLVWNGVLNGWNHIAVVYDNKTPKLYVNGQLVKTGLPSPKGTVHPSQGFPGGMYGPMYGQVDEVRVWNTVRTEQQIANAMNTMVSVSEPGLTAYWPLRQEDGNIVKDLTGHGYDFTLPTSYSAANWSGSAPALTDGASGTLQLYLDGQKLANLPNAGAPDYPYEWEINSGGSGYSLPANDLALLKHLRVYNRTSSDAEVFANAKNPCLSPVNGLAVQSSPLTVWGRFNLPARGSETTMGPGSIVESTGPATFIVPDHRMASTYVYNSLNQVVQQSSPDGGTSNFWYDRLGRLALSQNSEQKSPAQGADVDNPANRFSYTRYDEQGRIVEVGEKLGGDPVSEDLVRVDSLLKNWLNSGTNRQVTVTAYDAAPGWAPASLAGSQLNLRKRVTATALLSTSGAVTDPGQNRAAASYYSYDLTGNVSDLVQENTAFAGKQAQYINGATGLKHISYEYDLVSGKVNKVLYQNGQWDQFYYQYLYDAENRLIKALSSRQNYADPNRWVTEAVYRYYLHGPLARMELGKYSVQGVDYAYTLQGWLKGVNSQFLQPGQDMSGDAVTGSAFAGHARDVFGFSLGYYRGDYKPIGGTSAPAFGTTYQHPNLLPDGVTGRELFNGNISHATYAIEGLDGGKTVGYTYRYDQLNRLTAMNFERIADGATTWSNSNLPNGGAYSERISYDGNGNIETYFRNGADKAGMPLAMDNLTYHYKLVDGRKVDNRLLQVTDDPAIPSGNYTQASNGTEDIESQGIENYSYDAIGNLVGDQKENIGKISWTVYGKIASIQKNDGTVIRYTYDASGNRISKAVSTGATPNVVTTMTYYVRDAQGNVLGVYGDKTGDGLTWQEQHLYGSSRLGLVNPGFKIAQGQVLGSEAYQSSGDPLDNGVVGLRRYELSNHLGNVLATISDRSTGVDAGQDGVVDYYKAEVLSAQDYYPFGMVTPGRSYSAGSGYRYGFNAQEQDNEVKGEGNSISYSQRVYDVRLGRFLSIDPLYREYPHYSPYHFSSNQPIHAPELEGMESAHDLDVNDPNVHLMHKWSQQDGQGGTLLNNKYYNTFAQARSKMLAMGLGIMTSFYVAPAAAIRLGLIGAGVGGSFSAIKGGSAYDIAKGSFSGFYSGATLAGSPSKITSWGTSLGVMAKGGLSGMVGSAAEQTFDNMFGNGGGYDINQLALNGGIGAIANIFSTGVMQIVTKQIDEMVVKSLAQTETDSYRKTIQKAIQSETPNLGKRSLNKAVDARIREVQTLIKKQGEQLKAAATTAVERGTDALQEGVK